MKFFSPIVVLISLAICQSASAQSEAPLFDLVAKDGQVADRSRGQREVQVSDHIQAGADPDSVVADNRVCVTVPFEDKDAIFQTGPCTWMIRVKFSAEPEAVKGASAYLPMGRWNYLNDRRAIGMTINPNDGNTRFQVSTDGTANSRTTSGAQVEGFPPSGEWVTLVGTYSPGESMTIGIYADNGSEISIKKHAYDIPASYFEVDTPLVIGAPSEVGMAFSRVRIWDRVLSTSEIQDAVTGK